MSKEMIEKLRDYAEMAETESVASLMREAADALEAKAAPVGELREAFEAKYPAAKKLDFRGGVYLNRLGSELPRSVRDGINDAWVDFQAGAAYQRAQQPSAGVVMPEIPYQWSKSLTHCWPDDKDDRDGDWCVGCIDEEGNFYEVVKVEASQYDAGGESQKIAEAIVALWEFARLNGKEVGCE